MPLFPIRSGDIQDNVVTLNDEDSHHLLRVLRVGRNEKISLYDENGNRYEGRLANADRNAVINIQKTMPPVEPAHPLHLFMALLKGDKLDYIVEKAVELNLQAIHFIKTTRSVMTELSDSRWHRLQKIALSAQKQCGKAKPLELHPLKNFKDVQETGLSHIFLAERGEQREGLVQLLKTKKLAPPIGLWIGPEGGWTEDEMKLAQERGYHFASLGDLILRADTAALHAASMVIACL